MKAKIKTLLISVVMMLGWSCHDEIEPEPIVEISDNKFLNALIEIGIDTDKDSIISLEEAAIVTILEIDYDSISDLSGIEDFINLEVLTCSYNQLKIVDLKSNKSLKKLVIENNPLIFLDLSGNTALEELY